ncbi:preprotein translocase subunit SecA [bacterium]|nr:preprotein translocase subunit SecA [bacterium]NBX97862.1 preprotein translocase subunit SecA [bacterium]NDC94285.1 preprotein translocase subunit SecA [bacterium]NDG28706.1 preprotein translocase subunit SecA [bacterium]
MNKTFKRILGDPQVKTLKRLTKRVAAINSLEKKYKAMSDKQLASQTDVLRTRLKGKDTLDTILPDAFAVVREASRRVLGMRHFDVQLIGGMVLHEGKVAEMKTGEGKTLVATLPMYLNALQGKGAHLVTVNDYLVQRDAGWMGQIYTFLGLSVGVIIPEQSFIYDATFTNKDHEDERFAHLKPATRQEAYKADITYGTNNEYGFDYLRDNMVREIDQLRQRELNYAIVDEVDSILIDEARTPLIISASAAASGSAYAQFAKLSRQLKKDTHFEVDEKRRSVVLTDEGIEFVEKALGIPNLYDTVNIRTIYHLDQALKAHGLFKRDKDYVVTADGEVVIVDEFTGRLLAGRRYNEGLHQAIEAKEGVDVQEESMTLATISFQNYFRLYKKLSGMTGTANTEAEEFHMIYKLDVVEIPANRKLTRIDRSDRIYRTEAGKFKAIAKEVKVLHTKGQPVLIGTVSIEKNELLSSLLKKESIPHQILNAKNNEREAKIISGAGHKGAVTLATNIAGRGTDIVLDEDVKKLGGLFVLGSERHESRRIDNQLRGRSGRQGDPGESQFFVSTEDDLMRIFGGDRIAAVMNRLKIDDATPIENRVISKSLESAQKKVEGFNFDMRKNVVQYDDVMNRHRKATYIMRREILHQAEIGGRIKEFIKDEVRALVESPDSLKRGFDQVIASVFPFEDAQLDTLFDQPASKFQKVLEQEALEAYKMREDIFGSEIMRKVERDVYLQVLDNLWMQHLENMDHLREGIHWISVGQRDPLVEYRRQGQHLFEKMQQDLRHETLKSLFSAEPANFDNLDQPIETELTRAARSSVDNADKILDATEFEEQDFVSSSTAKASVAKKHNQKKKVRKAERTRKKAARKRR